jgi:N-dimethylarginine dimethylaminohydrolase
MNTTVLMCPPTYFDVRERKNPHMRLPIDLAEAKRQWDNLRRTLENCGIKVETIEPAKGLEDMVFAANQVFVGHCDKIGKFIVPSEMRYLSRQREVPFYVDWLEKRGYRVLALDLKGEHLEGHGDLLWHPGRRHIWAGYGFRSTRGAIDKFTAAMNELNISVTPLQLIDENCYHLDTCFAPLNADAVLIFPEAFAPASLEQIHKGWPRVHAIARAEALQFIANGVVANGHYITPRLTPNLSNILARENLAPVLVNTSEFEKSGGSAFCMKCFIE